MGEFGPLFRSFPYSPCHLFSLASLSQPAEFWEAIKSFRISPYPRHIPLYPLTTVSIIEISFLARIESYQEGIVSTPLLMLVGIVPFVIYIGVNYVLLPRFVGRRGAAESTARMKQSICAYYRERSGAFWTDAKHGRILLIASNAGACLLYGSAMTTPGAFPGVAPFDILSAGITISVVVYANLKRKKLKERFYLIEDDDGDA